MQFDSLEPPHLYLSVARPKEFAEYALTLNNEKHCDLAIRVVRGTKMRRVSDLYDEFAAALQFPEYFGENWDALEDCLTDLEWLPATGYVLFVSNALDVLGDEPDKQFEIFISVMFTVCEEWARATIPKPFHVLFQCEEGDIKSLRNRAQTMLASAPIFHVSVT
ncbi:MAG: barstar family protein [Terriglobales bacterium]